MARKTTIIKCQECGKKKEIPEYRIKQGKGKYCSVSCYAVVQRKKKLSEETKRKISISSSRNQSDPEYRKRMSEKLKGRIPHNKGKKGIFKHTEEHKKHMSKRMSGENHPQYNTKHSKEWNKKIGERSKKSWENPEYRKKLLIHVQGENNPMYGMKHSEKSKLEMSEKRKGKCIGEKNKRWRGGTFPYHYYGCNWKEQRAKIRKKTDVCERCKKKLKLNVHHKKPFRYFFIEYIEKEDIRNTTAWSVCDKICKKANRFSNLIVLCTRCHATVESKADKRYSKHSVSDLMNELEKRNITCSEYSMKKYKKSKPINTKGLVKK